jgi:hypothetical protein
MELLDFLVTVKLYVEMVCVCLVFICHFVAIEQLQLRLVSVYLCLVRIVEVMLQFELNSRQDEHNLGTVCVRP